MDQLEFDLGEGRDRKEQGQYLAARGREDILTLARRIAETIYRERQTPITADDVQRELINAGRTPAELGNAAGKIFDGRKWKHVGWQPSTRVSRHANRIGLWELRPTFL